MIILNGELLEFWLIGIVHNSVQYVGIMFIRIILVLVMAPSKVVYYHHTFLHFTSEN